MSINIVINDTPGILGSYFKAFGSGSRFSEGDTLPHIKINWEGVKFAEGKLGPYRDVCELDEDGHVPFLYPHSFLGGCHLKMLTHDDFPLKLLGAVHLRNHLIQYRPLNIDQSYDVFLNLCGQRRRPQGLEFDFTTEIKDGDELVWSSLTTFLVRKKFKEEDGEHPLSQAVTNLEDSKEAAKFEVPANTGKRFGKITGDINPIHMSKLLAKLFGFKRDICHGMWALGRGLPLLEGVDLKKPVRLDVAFKGPLYMQAPIKILSSSKGDGGFEFYSGKNDRPCVVGSLKNVTEDSKLEG